MISIRKSPEKESNTKIQPVKADAQERNSVLLKRLNQVAGILLLGGASVSDFRVRVAQSHLRGDLLPSFWSSAGILHGTEVLTVPIHAHMSATSVPSVNAITTRPLTDFDDPAKYPNMACVNFSSDLNEILAGVERLKGDRNILDIPSLLVPWLAYTWGAGEATNPL